MEAEARPRLGLREGENRETQMREREREMRRMHGGEGFGGY